MKDIGEQLISQYIKIIKSLFKVQPSDRGYTIFTPFIRPDEDYIELEMVKQDNGKVLITDNGEIMDYLFTSGINIETKEFQTQLSWIIKGFDLEKERGEIYKIVDQAVQKANTVALSGKMASFKNSRFLDLLDSLR